MDWWSSSCMKLRLEECLYEGTGSADLGKKQQWAYTYAKKRCDSNKLQIFNNLTKSFSKIHSDYSLLWLFERIISSQHKSHKNKLNYVFCSAYVFLYKFNTLEDALIKYDTVSIRLVLFFATGYYAPNMHFGPVISDFGSLDIHFKFLLSPRPGDLISSMRFPYCTKSSCKAFCQYLVVLEQFRL